MNILHLLITKQLNYTFENKLSVFVHKIPTEFKRILNTKFF